MNLNHIVPWGRSKDEYIKIFSLTKADLQKSILGCGDGPASFNAELTAAGGQVVSADPIYAFSSEQIHSRIEAVYPEIMSQLEKNQNDYIWDTHTSVESLGSARMATMKRFLKDYPAGRDSGRYINAALPVLPFNRDAFDLALCSHYLFLYSAQINLKDHLSSIKALCRVAGEVRIYPLLTLDGSRSVHLGPVMSALTNSGIHVTVQPVAYEFQKGATEMLVVKKEQVGQQ